MFKRLRRIEITEELMECVDYDLISAILLSVIAKNDEKDWQIRKVEEWQKETFLSYKQLLKARKNLEKLGYIEYKRVMVENGSVMVALKLRGE